MSPRAADAKMFLGISAIHHDCSAGWALATTAGDSEMDGNVATAPEDRLTAVNPARVANAEKNAAMVSASRNSRMARTPREPADSAVALAMAESVSASANGSAII